MLEANSLIPLGLIAACKTCKSCTKAGALKNKNNSRANIIPRMENNNGRNRLRPCQH